MMFTGGIAARRFSAWEQPLILPSLTMLHQFTVTASFIVLRYTIESGASRHVMVFKTEITCFVTWSAPCDDNSI
ncbi:hypothetical protein RRG08_038740 [Elysia crispata]|uniref:Uncharacterized protein n=1 Tax=Elysia crispata TaxID=231223 RepID=A0AAE1CUB6_9GAST|nr:hypothetical protein RRG08_038740 [Elysia crispata]